MKIMIKKFDSTKVQFDFIEFDTENSHYHTGNSAIDSRAYSHDLEITVETKKEFLKQTKKIRELS